MEKIPYGRHLIDDDDVAAVCDALRSEFITQGPLVRRFERAMASRCGARHAVACCSGSAALHLALLAAGIGPKDEVVVAANTFLSTANGAVHVGALPRFADVEADSGLMTSETLEPHLTEHVRAILPVHFAGLACDMSEISTLARRRCPQVRIIEDASHALGGLQRDGSPIGSLKWADMVTFSFHPVKHIATGEGGMVLTDDDSIAERLRRFRNHGMTKDPRSLTRTDEGPWYYEMHEVGHNFRIADINCALAISQLKKLDRFVKRRREIAAFYCQALAHLQHVNQPVRTPQDISSWHIYCLHIDFTALGKSRLEVTQELSEQGVGTQVHYFPVPLQPYYQQRFGFKEEDFPGAMRHYAQALTIPLSHGITDEQITHVVKSLCHVLRSKSVKFPRRAA